FGFINDLQSQDSIFVHINELDEPVNEQDKVTFEVEKGPKGLVAVRVKKVK
ncbi:MAG: cold shock domain-containing protein, partial [Chitinophagaceae bacterium]|nr:cold shock domain-containing protein [Chitinophagaceae bacterium]